MIEVPLLYRLNTPPVIEGTATGPSPQLADRLLDNTTDAIVDVGKGAQAQDASVASRPPVEVRSVR